MKDQIFDLVVVGGGAAGFFGAINAAEQNPGMKILVLERTSKLLSKVRVSGGGRCNVTHHCFEPTPLSKHYPRGQKLLKQLFRTFQAKDTVAWFVERGVSLKTEDDGRIFPTSDNSETIIQCFLQEAERLKIEIKTRAEVIGVKQLEQGFALSTGTGDSFQCKKLLIAVGGFNKEIAYDWLKTIGHTIKKPIPSLFTFNDSEKRFVDLMGLAVENAVVTIERTAFVESGPVLLTHWGLSGPAVIKLSAWAAMHLHDMNYEFKVLVNWVGGLKEHELRIELEKYKALNLMKMIANHAVYNVPARLWIRLCELSEIEPKRIWADMSKRQLNKLVENLTRSAFKIKGKTTFKEEFVICGGVAVDDVEAETMESKKVPGLYFAGEVLDIDGETGGFNFQSAWTTAFIASQHIAKSI
ncbi:MAG: NAD(P)/FAD-dependent oxidoreductase [Cyclobacteriaceae bacterium]